MVISEPGRNCVTPVSHIALCPQHRKYSALPSDEGQKIHEFGKDEKACSAPEASLRGGAGDH